MIVLHRAGSLVCSGLDCAAYAEWIRTCASSFRSPGTAAELTMHLHAQVYIGLASFSCSQAEDGSCGCKGGGLMGSVGGNLCIYQPEPGVKIPTSSPSRFSRAPFSGCEYVTARYCPPGFNGGDVGASCVAIAGTIKIPSEPCGDHSSPTAAAAQSLLTRQLRRNLAQCSLASAAICCAADATGH